LFTLLGARSAAAQEYIRRSFLVDDGHFEIITWADQAEKPAQVPQVAARAA
jgi:hypothetical protein